MNCRNEQTLDFGLAEWRVAYASALKILRAPDRAEDAAQEAMMLAFRARKRFENHTHPHRWLARIAKNTAISHLRRPFERRRADADVFEVIDRNSSRADADSPLQQTIEAELLAALRTALADLRARDRVAFEQRFLLGSTERELGVILGVSTNTARQRAFRARQRVRSKMRRIGGQHPPAREGTCRQSADPTNSNQSANSVNARVSA